MRLTIVTQLLLDETANGAKFFTYCGPLQRQKVAIAVREEDVLPTPPGYEHVAAGFEQPKSIAR
jgi:hypothetical protein